MKPSGVIWAAISLFSGGTVLIVDPGKVPRRAEIGNDLKAMQEVVGGLIYDLIVGTFFLCAAPPNSENFESLSEEQITHYQELFRNPDLFPGGEN